MLQIYKAKFDADDYGLFVLFILISAWQVWAHIAEIKGVLGNGYVEYSTAPGKIVRSGTKLYGGGTNPISTGYDVWYKYSVNDVTYKSNLITFDAHVKKVDEYLRKYPVNKVITVYYETNNPKFSVLEPNSLSWGVVIRPLLPLVVFFAYLLVFKRVVIKFGKKGEPPPV